MFQPLSETDDFEEIKALESEMLERANEKFRSFLDTSEYIWMLQVSLGSQTVTYTFNIGRPVRDEIRGLLTSEQIAKMEKEASHWQLRMRKKR